ncbi:branched-chain amino acid transport system ATP-binding protein [Roseomonas pecuniae]|uniref:Branched-chain amino acid transport system ATP-binding protein n=1 Tax=Muricoccus pecuniae TaxID=693023 RepID=A0A840XYZ5_9PROT|nr:ABC transporter ATP-binding protein [Roseomonas pecuniae]MBB5692500.1 branched-chain amino acid transport system ATP-binding protein [Roseomonas pecuniae]
MPEPLLELRGLRKRFGGLTVTDDVSLTVLPGEIHAVIGPNGAGKTTLIHQISGTLRPDEGEVVFAGQRVTDWSFPRRARAGLARSFQITCIVPGFTALENVALAVQARSGSSFRFFRPAHLEARLNEAARAALEGVGLGHRAGVVAGSMSHGEKRQLELAVALAMEPRLLLLDEPLAGAGPEETERLVALLRSLRQRYGILLVEHDMGAVFALADRVSVLVYGRVVITGTVEEIRSHPEVRSAYLGEDEMA